MALRAVSIDLPYFQKTLAAGLRLGINGFFDGLVPIFKTTISFPQLGPYQRTKAILEVPNTYVFVESSNEVEFFQDRLYVLQVSFLIHYFF